MSLLFFCEHFCTSCCISPTNFKKSTILPDIVSFSKIVCEIQQLVQQLVRKPSQKVNCNVIFHYISLPIYPLHFPKFCLIQKKKKLRNCQYLVKTTFAVYLVFYKLIFFESLIIFLKPTLKLITRIFDLQK